MNSRKGSQLLLTEVDGLAEIGPDPVVTSMAGFASDPVVTSLAAFAAALHPQVPGGRTAIPAARR
jgi:hypothetical protein